MTEIKPETVLIRQLLDTCPFSEEQRRRVRAEAARLIGDLRKLGPKRPRLDSFLQRYSLSNAEGISLMRLAEALVRTPDALMADQLIRERVADGDWTTHFGRSDSVLVNASSRSLAFAKHWTRHRSNNKDVALYDRHPFGSGIIRDIARRAMAFMGAEFVIGETITSALKQALKPGHGSSAFSFDMLGEGARTHADSRRYFSAYSQAISEIASQKAGDADFDPGISIKLSALHPSYIDRHARDCLPVLVDRVRELCNQAMSAGIQLSIDAEEHYRLGLHLDVFEAVAISGEYSAWDGLGIVVQAYHKDALDTLDRLRCLRDLRTAPINVRLVKGAYWDGEIKRAEQLGLAHYPVFTDKQATDLNYLACAAILLNEKESFFPQFATHNAVTACAILELADSDPDRFEFQRLFGMGEALHRKLTSDYGVVSRIYAPVGAHADLLAYLIRRLLENGANSSFVQQVLDENVPVERIARDPWTELQASPPDTRPAPRRYLGKGRLAAKGLDVETRLGFSEYARRIKQAETPVVPFETSSGRELVTSPAAPSVIIGSWETSDNEDVETAINSAHAALDDWQALNAAERAQHFTRLADSLEEDPDPFYKFCTSEAGKTALDAVAEVREAIDFCRYYASRSTDQFMNTRKGLGVIACISPWNFPLAIFLGQIVGALAAGNTVVAKPAEQTTLMAKALQDRWSALGLPRGVLNLVCGDGRVGACLTKHRKISGVCFTGSTHTAKLIENALLTHGGDPKVLIAETGGLNAMVVDSTALLEQACDDIILSAFSSAGQRCSALRLLCVQDEIAVPMLTMLKGAMETLNIGNPADPSTDIGPVIDEPSANAIRAHISQMRKGGHSVFQANAGAPNGAQFIPPTLIEINSTDDLDAEVFGPVLHVFRYKAQELEKTIDEINQKGYGLTFGVHSRIDKTTDWLAEKLSVGNVYINRNQIGAVVGVQPFGGEGLSGTGPKAGGPLYLRRLSQPETPGDDGQTFDSQLRLIKSIKNEMPSPAGEKNTYELLPRGSVVCVVSSEAELKIAQNRCVATGNTPVPVWLEDGSVLEIEAKLSHQSFDAVFIADMRCFSPVSRLLSSTRQDIVPIITPVCDADRYFKEKSVSNNTAAMGGDVELLARDRRATIDPPRSRALPSA